MSAARALVDGLDLQERRWFAGRGRKVAERVVVDEWACGPGWMVVVEVRYVDGGSERYLVPAIDDDGGLREARADDGVYAALIGGRTERALGVDQTNTSTIVDEQTVLKVFRRLEAGPNPEVEIAEGLAAFDADVPALRGVARRTLPDGTTVDLAIAQAWIAGAPDGWESLIEPLAEAIVGGDDAPVDPDLERIGGAAGRLHTALAAAFGLRAATPAERDAWRDRGLEQLDEAVRLVPTDLAHELEAAAPRIRATLDGLVEGPAPEVTRIHGDLHVAQFLRTPNRVYVIDFEGDPTRPLPERRAPGSPMRDLACLLRSLDHVARTAQTRTGAGTAAMDAWIAEAQEAVLRGYRAGIADGPVRLDRALVRRFAIEKETGEFVYAARLLPSWLFAPALGMQWLMRDDAAL
jgi:maltokinase